MDYQLPFLQKTDIIHQPILAIIKPVEPELKPKEPIKYEIKAGDTLTSISSHFNVPVARLWAANPELTNPDKIEPSKSLRIPEADEVLADRPFPVKIESSTAVDTRFEQTSAPSGRSSVSRPYSTHVDNGINTYSYGYCTWYAKNMRPDLPNSLGNASSWYARYTGAKGTTPRVGAIGQRGNHVVYITGVSGNTVEYLEMNGRAGWNKINSGTASASSFLYLY